MRYIELSYRRILEGFVKVNLIFVFILLFLLYFNFFSINDYFCFIKWQVVAWVTSVLFAVLYEKLRFNRHSHSLSIYESSIYVGAIITTIVCTVFAELFLHKVDTLEVVGIAILVCFIWGLYIFAVLRVEKFLIMRWLTTGLDSKISYKNLFQIFLLLNISCGIPIFLLLFLHNKYSLMEFLFLLFYFEVSFFVFHIIVAKLTDLVWSSSGIKSDTISLFGLVVASIFYVIKIRLVEESFFGVFEDVYINDSKAFILMIVLSLFWTFFALLFNFKIALPRKAN